MVADELAEAYDELAETKKARQDHATRAEQESAEDQDRNSAVLQSLDRLARRIEDVAARLEGA